MTNVNIHEAKTNFSKLVNRVMAGEEIIISKSGKPVAKLIPMGTENPQRKLGSARGKIFISDSFDDPLPEEITEEFYK